MYLFQVKYFISKSFYKIHYKLLVIIMKMYNFVNSFKIFNVLDKYLKLKFVRKY